MVKFMMMLGLTYGSILRSWKVKEGIQHVFFVFRGWFEVCKCNVNACDNCIERKRASFFYLVTRKRSFSYPCHSRRENLKNFNSFSKYKKISIKKFLFYFIENIVLKPYNYSKPFLNSILKKIEKIFVCVTYRWAKQTQQLETNAFTFPCKGELFCEIDVLWILPVPFHTSLSLRSLFPPFFWCKRGNCFKLAGDDY